MVKSVDAYSFTQSLENNLYLFLSITHFPDWGEWGYLIRSRGNKLSCLVDARNATKSVLKVKVEITGTCSFTARQGFVDAKSSYTISVNSFCEDSTSKFC